MKLIETKTLSSSQSAIEFTLIPQTFTDLVILTSTRDLATTGTIYLNFNGIFTGYTMRRLNSSGSGSNSDSPSTTEVYWNGTGTNETANTFGNGAVYITNYTSSTNKSVSVDGVLESNSATYIGAQMSIVAGMWSNSAPITTIRLGSNSGFAIGTMVSLYGITKGSDGITTTTP